MERIKLGVSSCLLGNRVRYNGEDKKSHYIVDTLGYYFDLVPICPEVEAGFGVPRESVILLNKKNTRVVKGHTGEDVTDDLLKWFPVGLERLTDVSGIIFKSKSPSCGVSDTKIFNNKNMIISTSGNGLFVNSFLEKYPNTPLFSDRDIDDPVQREKFITSVYLYSSWKKRSSVEEFNENFKYNFLLYGSGVYKKLSKLIGKESEYETFLMRLNNFVVTNKMHHDNFKRVISVFQERLKARERYELHHFIEEYRRGNKIWQEPVTLINHYINKLDINELKNQKYLNRPPWLQNLLNHA